MVDLAPLAWPSVGEDNLVLVPVGSTEQHGPHLPLDTDTTIALEVARAVAARLDGSPGRTVVAPAVTYGSSGEHQSFAGTVSIGADVLRAVLVELVRSLTTWAGRVVLVNGHGGNVGALKEAVGRLRLEGHDVVWVACAPRGTDAHAGFTETSLMLHLRPEHVRLDLAEVGNTAALSDLLPHLMRLGVRAMAPNGVLGDPTGATEQDGRRLFDQMVDDVHAAIDAGSIDAGGRVRTSVPAARVP